MFDVLIIGGGWSGLQMCKYVLEEGLQPIVFEKRSDLGGVWNYTADENVVTVQETTSTTSSPSLTEMSDFPMPPQMGNFPHHTALLHYLKLYATHFNLWERIHFNVCVEKVEKSQGYWRVQTNKGIYTALNVSVCSGAVGEFNRDIEKKALNEYSGTIVYGGQLKRFKEEFRNKTVVIIGGGETAADILEEWEPNVKQVYWAIPKGQHFFRKYSKLLPNRNPQVLDKASSRVLNIIAPYYKAKPGLSWICNWSSNGSLLAYQGHGMKEFRNTYDFMHSAINKNGHVLDLIDYERVLPKSSITECKGKVIHFDDNTSCEADLVIICTGYNAHLPFMQEKHRFSNIRDMYKHTIHPEDTSLSFVGFIRPVVGSISQLVEMQSRLVTMHISGKVDIGDREKINDDIKMQKSMYIKFVQTEDMRKQNVVEGYEYLDDVARLLGIYPNFWQLWNSGFREWYIAMFAPYNGATYRLNNLEERKKSLQTLKYHMKGSLGIPQYVLILFLRFFKFDLMLKMLGKMKYYFQTSPKFVGIRQSKFLAEMNAVWVLPKYWLFDRKTRAIRMKFANGIYSVFES